MEKQEAKQQQKKRYLLKNGSFRRFKKSKRYNKQMEYYLEQKSSKLIEIKRAVSMRKNFIL